MGYNSSFQINIVPKPTDELLDKILDDLNKYDLDVDYGWRDQCYPSIFASTDCRTYYDLDEFVSEISKNYPTLTFEIVSFGEEDGDITRVDIQNGKETQYRTVISFERIDK